MNIKRRGDIGSIVCTLNRCISTLENIHSDEEDYHDNIPENLENSERAEESEEALESLDSAINEISIGVEYLEDIAGGR